MQNDTGHVMFGLKFTRLTMKQNLIGSVNGRMRVGQEHKIVEIKGLEFYSRLFHGSMDLVTMNNKGDSYSASNIRLEEKHYYSILAPCDATLTLSDNRLQKLDGSAPQYSVTAELSGLVISLDEVQLQHMCLVWDYICTCRLREKYGRFRPWHCLLPRKCEGWQIFWWHYAQQSVLSDVRRKLKKTSWRYFGDRLSFRRKYMNLYKTKLDFLQQEQLVDDDVLQDLEQMEKESDLDDILNYRSAAESEMQEFLSRCSTPNDGKFNTDIPTEKSCNDEHTVKSRGWLNWLSRGMLGAGGTDDSSQFSGVVSYDVKDMSEATEFHPLVSSSSDAAVKHELYIFSMMFKIDQISATLCSKWHAKGIAEIIVEDGTIESKIYKDHGIVISKFKSGKMVDLSNKKVVVHIQGPVENHLLDNLDNSCSIRVKFSSQGDMDMSVKGVVKQLEVTVDTNILSNLFEFYDVFTSFKFHNERVMLSLNGIENDNIRLLSKAEYISVNHNKVVWDVTIGDVSVYFPWRNTTSEYSNLVMNSRSICFKSTNGLEYFSSKVEEQPYSVKKFLNSLSTFGLCMGIQLQDLYQFFDVTLDDFMITAINSDQSKRISILEKFSVSFFLAFCLIPEETILKQLEVYVSIESLKAHFSPSIYGAFIELMNHMATLHLMGEFGVLNSSHPPNIVSVVPAYSTFGISIVSKIDLVDLEVHLEYDGDSHSELMVSLQNLVVRYVSTEFEEFFVSTKSVVIGANKMKEDSHVLLSGNLLSPGSTVGEDCVPGPNIEFDQHSDMALLADSCFIMHYKSSRTDVVSHRTFMYLSNTDIHCYPLITGLLIGFFHRLSAYTSSFEKSCGRNTVDFSKKFAGLGLQKFGFSNYFNSGSTDSACIPMDSFPFVTIHNSGSLGNLESALIHGSGDWRNCFTARDRKVENSNINMRVGSKMFQVFPSKSKSDFGSAHEPEIVSNCDIFHTELHLSGIRTHFHDSSCIIGTINVPTLFLWGAQ
ncbi:hypothetical protein PHAVU_002G234304 [Phaseolus vulgaris]